MWCARHGAALLALAGAGCAVSLPAPPRKPTPPMIPAEVLRRAETGEAPPEARPARPDTRERAGQDLLDRIVGDLIEVSRSLGDPADIVELTVDLHVGDRHRMPDTPNQRAERRPFGQWRIQVRSAPGAHVTPGERAVALAWHPDIDWHHPAIAAAASRLAVPESEEARVARLVAWVRGTLRYEPASETRPAAILERGAGDCTEYTRLFVAVARAAGVPAREVAGLAYTEVGGRPAFGWHAWAEVAIGGRWVPVDPTWGQSVADATHIKFAHGTSTSWMHSIRSVDIRIVDAKRRSDP